MAISVMDGSAPTSTSVWSAHMIARRKGSDEIMVIGYMAEGQPRAYPTGLLDRHEVVNDQTGETAYAAVW